MNSYRLGFVALCVFVVPLEATAHIRLDAPPSRYENNPLKSSPCGMPGNPAGTKAPTILQGGDVTTVVVTETIEHAGHLRIAVAASDAEFVDPTSFVDFYNADNVILDGIEDPAIDTDVFEVPITVPNIDCERCVLQVIQVMEEGAFGPEDLYFDCADITIIAADAPTSGSETGETSSAGTTTTTGSGSGSGSTVDSTTTTATVMTDSHGTEGGDDEATSPRGTGASTTPGASGGCHIGAPVRGALAPLACLVLGVLRRRRVTPHRDSVGRRR